MNWGEQTTTTQSAEALAAFHGIVGTRPDAEVATLAGVSAEAVKAYRRAHGIAPFLRSPPGMVPPPPPAESVVRRRRDAKETRVEIRAPVAKPAAPAVEAPVVEAAAAASAPPTPEETSAPLLVAEASPTYGAEVVEAVTDAEGVAAVASGVEADGGEAAPALEPDGALVASDTTADAAESMPAAQGRPAVKTRIRRSAIDPWRHLLGTLSDGEVAEYAGVTTSAVIQYRRKHGIAAAGRAERGHGGRPADAQAPRESVATPAPAVVASGPREAARPAARRARRSALDAWRHLVGTVSDADVAARAGVTPAAVTQYRHKHGIPSARESGALTGGAPARRGRAASDVAAPRSAVAEARVAPVAPESSAPRVTQAAPAATVGAAAGKAAALDAYGVRARNAAGDTRFVVVAADMVDAATRATAALAARADGPWTLQYVRLLCEALV